TVKAGGILDGTGTVLGAVTVESGGVLSSGVDTPFSPAVTGILQTGNLTLDSGAHLDIVLAGPEPGVGGYDQVMVTGTVQLTGAVLDLELTSTNVSVPGIVEIIDNEGTAPVIGTFAGLPEGAIFSSAGGFVGKYFAISYHGGDGNDVVLESRP